MRSRISDEAAYGKIIGAFKRKRGGATEADIVAATGLPLEKVRGLVPVASDEFGARLQVTESGEILYSFPSGFKSRYRGLGPTLKRAIRGLRRGVVAVATFLFKVWIAVMLVGYFVLFIALALFAMVASVAVSASGSSDSRSSSRRGGGMGGFFLVSRLFDMIIRLWFYSEIASAAGANYGNGRQYRPGAANRTKRRPLHKAIYSFVFGDGDPNADWSERERKAVIAYIVANKGVITLPEFMALTGQDAAAAERSIGAYLVEFGGSPEATEDGVVVYRFDELMRRTDSVSPSASGLSGPLKRLKKFSANPKKMNGWFIALNGVNLLFGGYFLYFSSVLGPVTSNAQITGASYLYALTLHLMGGLSDPATVAAVSVALGWVPVIFAILFYAVPGLRSLRERSENEGLKSENLRKAAWAQVWSSGGSKIKPSDVAVSGPELSPADGPAAKDRVLAELAPVAPPEIEAEEGGGFSYAYPELGRQKRSVESYRSSIDEKNYDIGATVFDSHE